MTSDNTIAQVGIVATGTIKNDKIDGTSRNDVLDGGAGSDEVKAGSGNDTLIYTMAQNAGARDRYDGGSDTDTLRLNFTTAEWASAAVKADVARYAAFLAPAPGAKGDDHGTEAAGVSSDWFTFKVFGLEVRNVEKLQIYVNNVLTDLNAGIPANNAPVVTNSAAALLGAVIEDAALTTSGQLSATDADAGATLAWSVQGAAVGTYGSLALNSATGQWTYTLNNSAAVVQALATGETHNESFTVRVTDDKGAFVNQTVVVTVNGSNDAAVLSSAVVALTETNAALSTGGTLTNSDIDSAQTFVAQSNVAGANGHFSITSAGAWTYTANSAFDSLNVGQSVSDSFTVTAADGTTTSVSVSINGTNDKAVITGVATASLTETDAPLSTGGALSATDVDGSAAFVAQSDIVGSNGYGVFAIDATGTWTYSAGAHNEFVGGQSYTDSFTVATADGTPQVVTVTIAGTNDAAVITGTATASLTETNAALATGGTLSATDVDSSAAFVAQSDIAGGYGVFAIDTTGAWTYNAGAHNEFAAGQSYTDSFTVATADGTEQVVTVTIAGTNDAAIITGIATASLTETDAPLSTGGALSATDVDSSAAFVAQSGVAGSNNFGVFSINAAGAWTYNAGAHNEFAAGQNYTDSLTVATADGTSQVITVTIAGSNDAAQITGTSTASLTETDAALSASGTLSATDVDSSAAFVAQTNAAGSNGYGVFAIDTAGAWTYSAGAHNEFVDGQSYTDSVTVATADGTQQVITVTINGTNEAPVVTSAATANYAERGGTGTAYTATASDADAGTTTFSYAIAGTDATLFNINASTGAVRFNTAPDYEAPTDAGANNVYDITVSASDGVNTSAAQAVAITVTNVLLTGEGVIDLGSYGKLIAPVQVDGGKWFYYWDRSGNGTSANSGSLNGGVDTATHDVLDGLFQYDVNGVLNTATGTDTNNTYRYWTLDGVTMALPTYGASAAVNGSAFKAQTVVGTTPAATGTNGVNNTYDDLLAVWDAYNGRGTTSLQHPSGVPTGWFNNTYWAATSTTTASQHVYVTLTNGIVSQATDTTIFNVALQVVFNDVATPVLTSAATARFAENGTGVAYQATFTDADSPVLTYALAGTDAAAFNFNASTGAVTFKAAPNYELPTDAGANNVYDITVTASDRIHTTAAQAVAISVTNVYEVLSGVTSAATASFAENGTGTAYTVRGVDSDSSSTANYTIGGTDAALFDINASTGVVTFKTAPDYEIPADAGANNVYDITVTASDGLNTSAAQAVAITVTDQVGSLDRSVIDLGSYGKLIAPVQVDGGNWFYFWDRSGNGTSTPDDITTHDALDGIFNEDISGVVGGAGNTTDIYRYATLNGVHLALPTAGGVTSAPFGASGINFYQPGTTVGSSPASTGSNAANATYNDLLAVWDAYNGTGTTANNFTSGTPGGWPANNFWSATPTGSVNHASVDLSNAQVTNLPDTVTIYVALQVL